MSDSLVEIMIEGLKVFLVLWRLFVLLVKLLKFTINVILQGLFFDLSLQKWLVFSLGKFVVLFKVNFINS